MHGITDEKVKNEPNFKELYLEIFDLIKDCDLAGYNSNKFDIPLLVEEFLRCDKHFKFSDFKAIQPGLKKKNKRSVFSLGME